MTMNNDQQESKTQQTRGRTTLVLLLIFFLVPMVVVMFMLKFDWRPKGQSNGELLKPAIKLNAPSENHTFWNDKWHVVYIDEQCLEGCMLKLKALRNLHVSMYKNMLRVKIVLITKRQEVESLKTQYPDLLVLNEETSNLAEVVNGFKVGHSLPYAEGALYFVDPLGFLVMRYMPEVPLKDVRKDLVKLLKFAWAG